MAHVLQFPARPTKQVLVLQSEGKGTGKSMWGVWLRQLIGNRHSVTASSVGQLTGKFNDDLEGCILACAEELSTRDEAGAVEVLRNLVNNPHLTIEPKGLGRYSVPNYLNILWTTNHRRSAPMSTDERRFAFVSFEFDRRNDPSYFKPMHVQMDTGGLQAMYEDLMAADLTDFNAERPVKSQAHYQQIERGLTRAQSFVYSLAMDGMYYDQDDEVSLKAYDAFVPTSAYAHLVNPVSKLPPRSPLLGEYTDLMTDCGAVRHRTATKKGFCISDLSVFKDRVLIRLGLPTHDAAVPDMNSPA
jgi:hypothetical protein